MFYGFNFQNNPQFSRLFGQNVMNNAQQAFGQGMSQFTPFNARKDGMAFLEQARARQMASRPQAPAPVKQTGNWFVGKDGRLVDGSNEKAVRDYMISVSTRTGTSPLKYSGYSFENFQKDPSKFGLTPFTR